MAGIMKFSGSLLTLGLMFFSGVLHASTLTIGLDGSDDTSVSDGMVDFNEQPVAGDMKLSAVAVSTALVFSDVTLQRTEGIVVNEAVSNATGSTLTLQTAGTDGGNILLNADVALNGTLALKSSCSSCRGGVFQNIDPLISALSAASLEIDANDVVLSGTRNDFGTVSGVVGDSLYLTDQNALEVTGLSAGFAIDITAGGQVVVPLLGGVFETKNLLLTADSFAIDAAGGSFADGQTIQVLSAAFFDVSLLDSDVKVTGLDPDFLLDTTSLFSNGQVVVRSVPDVQIVPLPSSLLLSLTVIGALCGLRRCTPRQTRGSV